ncbi:MAG: hypothetical protein A2Y63_05655 [Candidatus Riflebacteria bacterium RBG_13_59_9]|nr:MAG: hypothetical protein A2Y63_05655 [Candidatus Riflebacteria bacterium RBG_13_59_9]
MLHRYTYQQVFQFLEAAERNRKAELYELALIMRAAQHAQSKDFERLMKAFTRGKAAERQVMVSTAAQVQELNLILGGKKGL